MKKIKTGYKEASDALSQKGLRVTKAEFCPKVETTFKWVVFKKGLDPKTLENHQAHSFGDNLTKLVADINPAASKLPSETTPPPKPLTVGDDDLPEAGTSKADALVQLIRNLVPPGLTEPQIRKIIDEAISKALTPKQVIHHLEIPQSVDPQAIQGQHETFPTLLAEMQMGHGVAITGPAGSGKTYGAIEAAKRLGMTVHVQASMDDAFDLLGFRDAQGNYQPTPAYRWATDQNPKGSVLILDEMDRADARALCAAHAMMANGIVNFPHEEVQVPPQHLVICTMNTWGSGATGQYVGAAKLDGATLNRFPTRLVWDYDVDLEANIIQGVCGGDKAPKHIGGVVAGWSSKLRDVLHKQGVYVIWSPRDSMAFAKRLASGVSFDRAIERSVLATLDKGPRERVLQAVGKIDLGIKEAKTTIPSIPANMECV